MYSLDIFTLKDRVEMDLGLSVYGDMFRLFSPEDPPRGIYLFKDLIERAMDRYSVVYSVHLRKYMTGGNVYQFKDNFDQYLSGEIDESQLELIPLEIAHLGDRFQAGYYWDYDKRTGTIFTMNGGSLSGYCRYWAANPYKINIGPDNNFTSDSYIYFTYPKDEDRYVIWLDLEVAKKLKNIARSINIQSPIEILPEIDQIIADLENQKRGMIRASGNPILMWRK